MVFDLAVNIHVFPKCGKCGKDMVLVKVSEIETEEEMGELGGMHSSNVTHSGEKEKQTADSAFFMWQCSCGNILGGHGKFASLSSKGEAPVRSGFG